MKIFLNLIISYFFVIPISLIGCENVNTISDKLHGQIICEGSWRGNDEPSFGAIDVSNGKIIKSDSFYNNLDIKKVESLNNIVKNKGRVFFPTISPDGTKIVFLLTKNYFDIPLIHDKKVMLCLFDINTKTFRELIGNIAIGRANSPSWSPNNTFVVLCIDDENIAFINIETGEAKIVASGKLSSWNSVEQNLIAYVSGKSLQKIELINPFLLKERKTYKSEGSIISITWSPDGDYIVYVESYQKGVRFVILDKQLQRVKTIDSQDLFYINRNIVWIKN